MHNTLDAVNKNLNKHHLMSEKKKKEKRKEKKSNKLLQMILFSHCQNFTDVRNSQGLC